MSHGYIALWKRFDCYGRCFCDMFIKQDAKKYIAAESKVDGLVVHGRTIIKGVDAKIDLDRN